MPRRTAARCPSLVPILLCCSVFSICGCRSGSTFPGSDSPRLTPDVTLVDVTFRSAALDRTMPYRVILPKNIPQRLRLPVVYLLHGGGGGFRDWSDDSDVAQFAAKGLILVMPEGESSYYVNSATKPHDRYEDYLVHDLISDVEHRFPAASDPSSRAIVGVSMGGYGAVYLALKHPDLFVFAGAISPALDVPSRPFSIHRVSQWKRFRDIFGPIGSATERAGDPYVLEQSADPAQTPYLYLACGEQEALLGPDRRFATDVDKRHFRSEFHTAPGGHEWKQWNEQIPGLFRSLLQHMPPSNLAGS